MNWLISPRFAAISLTTALLFAMGCGGGVGANAASNVLKHPELPTDTQSKCKVAKSQSEPLVVEWPDTARGKLESMARHGLVAVRYEGCELEVLARCKVKSTAYGYSPITRKESRITIKDEDDLYASMPVGAARLEGKLKSAGQLNVAMTIVGRYEAAATGVSRDDLEGECGEATHIVAALTVGSFTFFAGADAHVAGSAGLGSAGAGGSSAAARETLQRDGDEAACARASASDTAPPEGCGALLQIEVMPLRAKVAAAPVPAPIVEPPPSKPPPRHVAPTPAPYVPPVRSTATNADSNATPERDNPLRVAALYGVVGFGLTSVLSGSLALAKAADAKNACNDATQTCTSEFASKRSDARTYAVIADVALGLTAVSGILLLVLPAKVSVAPTQGGAIVGTQGSF